MQKFDVGILLHCSAQAFVKRIELDFFAFYRTILLLSKAYGIRTAVFTAEDIHLQDGRLFASALYWEDGCLQQTSAPLPLLLDHSHSPLHFPKFFSPDITQALLKLRLLSGNGVSKAELPGFLKSCRMQQYAIPTFSIRRFEDIAAAALHWQRCVLKPANGRMGLGIIYVELSGDALNYRTSTESGDLTAERWQELCSKWPDFQYYLGQPYLDFHNAAGHALDFRLLVSHGAGGKWETIGIYPRIGATQVVSNVSRGGTIGDAGEILTEEYGSAATTLYEQLELLAAKLPPLIEAESGAAVTCLGLDVGIDRPSQQPYLIEANTQPGARYHYWKLAEKRVQYYKHLVESHAG